MSEEIVTKKDLQKDLVGLEKDLKAEKDKEKKVEIQAQIAAVRESIKVIEDSEAVAAEEEATRKADAKAEAAKAEAKANAKNEVDKADKAKKNVKDINQLKATVKGFTPIKPVAMYFEKSFWSVELGRSIKKGAFTCRSKEEFEVLKPRNADLKVLSQRPGFKVG